MKVGDSLTDYSAWPYKNSILVYGSPDGAQTNYQVEVTIPYQSFMRSDFGDIRFTDIDGNDIPYHLRMPVSSIIPYSGVRGGYGVTTDPITGLNSIYLTSVFNSYRSTAWRPIDAYTGRWDVTFRLANASSNQFIYYFLSTSLYEGPGYAIVADYSSATVSLLKVTGQDTDSSTILLSAPLTNLNSMHDLGVSRDNSGNFVLYLDGANVGTVKDTTYTTGFVRDYIESWAGTGTQTAYVSSIIKDGISIFPFQPNPVFVLNIPTIPSGSNNYILINVYAGNPNVTTTSNPDNVYLFYDDCTGTLTDKWNVVSGASAYASVGGITAIQLASDPTVLRTKTFQITRPFKVELDIFESSIITALEYCQGSTPGVNTNYQARLDIRVPYPPSILNGAAQIGTAIGYNLSANIWYPSNLTLDQNGNHKWSVDGVIEAEAIDNTYTTGYLTLYGYNGGVKNFYVSSYTENPPTVGSLGSWVSSLAQVLIYGNISNQSSLSGKFNCKSLITGSISNQGSLFFGSFVQSYITGIISNTSDFNYILGNLEIFIKGSISNTSIIQGKFNRKSDIAGIIYNISSFSPHILGNLKYFYGIISNISSFKPIIKDDTFYLIEDDTGTEIQQLQFEPLYQGDVSSVKEIVLKAVPGYGDLNISISAYDLDDTSIPEELQAASENAEEYIKLSTTGDPGGDWENTINVDLPANGSVTFYVQANPPVNAVTGGWMCGLNTQTDVLNIPRSKNIILNGTVLTGNPVIQSGGVSNLAIILELGNMQFDDLTKFKVEDRINDPSKTFEVDYSTADYPEEFIEWTADYSFSGN